MRQFMRPKGTNYAELGICECIPDFDNNPFWTDIPIYSFESGFPVDGYLLFSRSLDRVNFS